MRVLCRTIELKIRMSDPVRYLIRNWGNISFPLYMLTSFIGFGLVASIH